MQFKPNELLSVKGHVMPRWVAEKLGLIPVTIGRCLRALSEEFSNSPPHVLFSQDDLFWLFRSSEYMQPLAQSWTGGFTIIDLDGKEALAFWPFHLRRKT